MTQLFAGLQTRRILGVAAGAASAHGVVLLASPILTRLYSPADFGVYSFFFAALGFVAPVATLRYELAIPLPRSDKAARGIAALGLLASAALTTLLAVVLGVGKWLGIPPLADASTAFLLGLPAGVAATGVYQITNYLAVRHERFGSIAVARGGLGIGTSLVQVVLGATAFGSAGLVIGDVVGRIVSAGTLVAGLPDAAREIGRKLSVRALRRRAKVLRGFPLLSAPAILLNSFGLYLPLAAIGYHYGAAEAGLLFLAQRAVGLPSALLSSATSQVYIAELTRGGRQNPVPIFRQTVARLFGLAVVPFIIAAAVSPVVFGPLFGAEWINAGQLAMILVPFYFFQLLSGATISTLDVLMLHKARFLRETVFVVVTVAVFATPLVWHLNLNDLVLLHSFVGSLFYIGSLLYVRLLLGQRAPGR